MIAATPRAVGVFILLACCGSLVPGSRASDEIPGCPVLRHLEESGRPKVTWTPLSAGIRLDVWDAISTCENSRLVLTSSAPFGGSSLAWQQAGNTWTGTASSHVFAVVYPHSPSDSIAVEVQHVEGHAFYSRDREAIRAARVRGGRIGTDRDAWVVEGKRKQAEMYRDLRSMPWDSLREGDTLGPWDMLWVQAGGRTEIEMLGRNGLIDGAADVTDRDGRPTGRKRFRAETYWILLPDLYDAARVTRVLGDVLRSSNEEQVKRFYRQYRTLSGTLRDPAEEQTETDARERVRRSDPEAYDRLWDEHVGRRSDEYGRWLESLKGGDLE